MNDKKMVNPQTIKSFLEGAQPVEFIIVKAERYCWIASTLKRTGYFQLRKGEKTIIVEYMLKMTHYSRQQLVRLIQQYRGKKRIGQPRSMRQSFAKRYNHEDISLLVKTDEYHQTPSGGTVKKLFERAYKVYNDSRYERLVTISISHIYNLRNSNAYQCQRRHFTKTTPSPVNMGQRKQPQPNGQPGYIRIDTVHQGDQDKVKGVYHINAIDEVTQMEIVCSVEKISEQYLIPVLAALLENFPFKIINFHSDNGSEYVNHTVVKLLSKLHIEFTKSRARKTNDNALVESKNGAIVRKFLGHIHIPQQWATLINKFNQDYLNPYINYHRPCYFSEITIDKKGKQKKKYPYSLMMTPYDKLKSLPDAESYLKPGVTFEALDKIVLEKTDMQAAEELRKAQKTLFNTIFEK